MEPKRAISVRQPYAEQILRGTKRFEYRSIRTNIRERVYIYASLRPADDTEPTECQGLPRGVIVGTVEIAGCGEDGNGGFAWVLKEPRRLDVPIKPRKQPQPVWFNPF
jgi:hypothetical protein